MLANFSPINYVIKSMVNANSNRLTSCHDNHRFCHYELAVESYISALFEEIVAYQARLNDRNPTYSIPSDIALSA
ncbi:MAG: hypothetical protein ACPG5K_08970, partial [Glaciecola sp.]